jgi:putative membrane protein
VSALPHLNAALNATSAALLALGWWLVRSGRRDAHRVAMLAALGTSSLFLVSYLVYHFQVGSVRFPGHGAVRAAYLAVLVSHTVLAVAIVPLVLMTLARALRGRYQAHRSLARYTLPLWLWVSVSGVVVYWMLYRVRY